MKRFIPFRFYPLLVLVLGFFLAAFSRWTDKPKFEFPFRKTGLTDREAAAHLLNRFTYGPSPGQVEEVVKIGPEKWFLQQLQVQLPDDSLEHLLSNYDALKLSNSEIVKIYPQGGQVRRMAIKEGVISEDSLAAGNKKDYRQQLKAFMQQKGFRPQQELFRQFVNQKVLRAAYSRNQLQEVMTDFWFNHFNVSLTKNQCAEFIPSYERDVIRPNVFGKFGTLLLATAKSPAMLFYLDNFSSSASNEERMAANPSPNKKVQGLNENYAREVMELHTLGVDGGYTQQDVTQAAKVLTGWTVFPMGRYGAANSMQKMIERVGEDQLVKRGFVHEGDFVFIPTRHDKHDKNVLGRKFKAGGGYEEGVQLLEMLAHHPSTAKFISRKLAVRFVNDNPPQSLVDKMARTFEEKDGDIREVLITMVCSAEFWSPAALREKTKSPFELAISTVRALDADIYQPYQLYNWITKMGQKVYFYQAPTGFPDRGQYWINTGSLLSRMNFGLAIASQRIPGVRVNLLALNHSREPESAEAALLSYSKLLMPARDVSETVKRLVPMLKDPELTQKVAEAAGKNVQPHQMETEDLLGENIKEKNLPKRLKKNSGQAAAAANGTDTMLAQVVGVIIGSPEFQRK